jgi:hypothetical protein
MKPEGNGGFEDGTSRLSRKSRFSYHDEILERSEHEAPPWADDPAEWHNWAPDPGAPSVAGTQESGLTGTTGSPACDHPGCRHLACSTSPGGNWCADHLAPCLVPTNDIAGVEQVVEQRTGLSAGIKGQRGEGHRLSLMHSRSTIVHKSKLSVKGTSSFPPVRQARLARGFGTDLGCDAAKINCSRCFSRHRERLQELRQPCAPPPVEDPLDDISHEQREPQQTGTRNSGDRSSLTGIGTPRGEYSAKCLPA